jgi:hypothetical protein
MTTICEDMIFTSDYLHTATDLHVVICGSKAKPFHPANWHPVIRGTDPDTGAIIGVAGYEMVYEKKVDAAAKARLIMAHVKKLRAEHLEPVK